MRKKATNDDVQKLIKQCAEDVISKIDFDCRVAESRMYMAEKDLLETFSEEQKRLYEEYLAERNRYFDIFQQKCKIGRGKNIWHTVIDNWHFVIIIK